jgi:ATP-dependent RNA helicase DDX49/DBP8
VLCYSCAGKTAAFALPILNELSDDPYGIFAVVLTPTRELAMQIAEQFSAFGAALSLRLALVIGGNSLVDQSVALSRRPHIIVATPGRLRHHVMSADPPNFRMTRYLVLDEADRLLSIGFESDLAAIFNALPKKRNTLLFSATLTDSLSKLDQFIARDTLKFDLTSAQKVPLTLLQQYLFVPSQVKICFLVAVLKKLIQNEEDLRLKLAEDAVGMSKKKGGDRDKGHGKGKGGDKKRRRGDDEEPLLELKESSVIIFVGSCKRCQETLELLKQMNIACVSLHSLMTQFDRTESLGRFKSQQCNILIATDVASRGLDIPQVAVVINFDLPKIAADYVHRVGRTARAGRSGRSLSLITPHDVELLHSIEEYIDMKLTESTEIKEEDVVPLLNAVAKAMKTSSMKLMEAGFDDKVDVLKKRKKKQNKMQLRQLRDRVRAEGVGDASSNSAV